MYECTFPFGDLEIVAVSGKSVLGLEYGRPLDAMRAFCAYIKDLSTHRLAELSGLFAAANREVHFLNAHGHSQDGQWVVEDRREEYQPIHDVLNAYPACAWLLLTYNPDEHHIKPQQPCLYPLDAIYVPGKITWDPKTRTWLPLSNHNHRFVLWGASPQHDTQVEKLHAPLQELEVLIQEETQQFNNSPDRMAPVKVSPSVRGCHLLASHIPPRKLTFPVRDIPLVSLLGYEKRLDPRMALKKPIFLEPREPSSRWQPRLFHRSQIEFPSEG